MSTTERQTLRPNLKASLSLFLGVPVTKAFEAGSIASYQAVYAGIAKQPRRR
jgi:hypothetical protein